MAGLARRVFLVKPQSFMVVQPASHEITRFYKISVGNIFVFYDEIDLAIGKVQLKQGGGYGGHNGIRDLDPGADYWRVRIGVGRPQCG